MALLDDIIIKRSLQLIVVCIAFVVLLMTGAIVFGFLKAMLGG
jgi:hypothetical protein